MLDKDKLFMIVYVGVDALNKSKAIQILSELDARLHAQYDSSINILVLPCRDKSDIHVEFFNLHDNNMDEDKLIRFEEACLNLKSNINKFMNFD